MDSLALRSHFRELVRTRLTNRTLETQPFALDMSSPECSQDTIAAACMPVRLLRRWSETHNCLSVKVVAGEVSLEGRLLVVEE